MRQQLFFQDTSSNKFWTAESDGTTQIISSGAVGTKGRQSEKQFASAEACLADTKKLIQQKIKKGYIRLTEGEIIPEKQASSPDEIGQQFFWRSIEKSNKKHNSNWSEYNIDEHIENLTELLSKSGKQKLIQFEKQLQIYLQRLYTAEIAELSVILECDFKKENEIIIFDHSLSEDGFIYFRCWLLLKGQEFFTEISQDINALVNGKYSFNIGDTWGEGLLYVADEAYSVNHDNEDDSEIRDAVADQFPEVIHYDSMDRVMNREPKGGAELQAMYPKLVEEIVRVRS
ncbi:DUF4240 domain-containing protein [Hymenobacter negativus]|uniref:DUF4240 domain-containing protein n=1 Tax=Hymenobacter negativus TaxID=2795026 RepID=A0ABS3QD49_9BACT|nr:DUF4240 domain-containing protein [Hymenobacter negativus]MBO2008903.1 DUF4240 domain-containing protein [Hymenobacter negativus]